MTFQELKKENIKGAKSIGYHVYHESPDCVILCKNDFAQEWIVTNEGILANGRPTTEVERTWLRNQ